jgi:O-antigen/teichoic acid export membrane protein
MNDNRNLSLVRRTILTFISNILSQGARLLISFLVTPVIIIGLGKDLYGVWGIIQQVIGYFTLSDLRPAGAMKLLLTVKQHEVDLDEKKRLIGSTLTLWIISMPLMALTGYLLIYYSPLIIKVEPKYINSMQLALGIMILGAVFDRLLSIPSIVLRGQNLEYKGMGITAGMVLLGGGLNAAAIWLGWGVTGLAFMSFLGILISSAIRFRVAKNALPWLSFQKPQKAEFTEFTKTSLWLSFSSLSGLLLNSSDILLIGYFLAPSQAAVYLTTGSVLRLLIDPLTMLFSSANAGLAGLCGKGEWERVGQLRSEMILIATVVVTIIGVGFISLNKYFLELWIGDGFFGGELLNILLVVVFFLTVFLRIDSAIVSAMMLFREQAKIFFVGGMVSIIVGVLSMPFLGLVGMTLGLISGQFLVLAFTWVLIARKIPIRVFDYFGGITRPLLTGLGLLLVSIFVNSHIHAGSWFFFLLWVAGIGIVALVVMWFIGLSQPAKSILLNRISTIGIDRIIPFRR